MQSVNKIVEINQLLSDISQKNLELCNPVIGSYYDYGKVIEMLTKIKKEIELTCISPRPDGFPLNIIWNEEFYNCDNEPDPFVFTGKMSLDDFEKWQEEVLEDISLER